MAAVPLPGRVTPPVLAPLVRLGSRFRSGLESLGRQFAFYVLALLWVPRAVKRYRKECLRLLAEVSLGSGALAVIGGTVGVVVVLATFTGSQLGLEGFKGLDLIGISALSGFISSYVNTREIAPLIAGLALSAQVGCGFTAQLGAMRISEEVDALEVMAIPSVPYLVSTRIFAAMVAIVPLFLMSLTACYVATQLFVTTSYSLSSGTYEHYFYVFLSPSDVFCSLVKVIVFAVVIALVHCYYGYFARGGAEGVGQAVGKAIRTAIVVVVIIDMALSLVFFGVNQSVRLSG